MCGKKVVKKKKNPRIYHHYLPARKPELYVGIEVITYFLHFLQRATSNQAFLQKKWNK